MKIEITTHLDRASVERAEELTAAQNRWAAEESSVQRAAPWSIETWIAARLQSWIRADWEREGCRAPRTNAYRADVAAGRDPDDRAAEELL